MYISVLRKRLEVVDEALQVALIVHVFRAEDPVRR